MQLLLSAISLGLTSAVIGNAWYQKKQFYPAVVYITKSNASMALIYIQFFAIVFMLGKLLRKIFLGTLRAAEFEHLLERFWYAITETCLTFTVFRDDFNPRFVALFTVLLFLKSFHWLAEERVNFMERSPVLGWLFHIRIASLLMVLGILDYMLLVHAYSSTLTHGPTVQLVFGFEYAILLTVVANTAIKYVLHAAEMRTDTPWENKAVFLLYTELLIGFVKVVLYVLFVVIMAKVYALPMFVFRPMFFTIRNFKKALSDVIMSRRAIRNMNTLYPDATPEELRLSDNICIICREDMINHSKKLPCGHIFHTICLRSWFQRQQTCPTCRLNILRAPAATSTALPRVDENNAIANGAVAAAAGAGNADPATGNPHVANANVPESENRNPQAGNIFQNFVGLPNSVSNMPSTGVNGSPNFTGLPMMPPPPFMMPPPFPFIAPYDVPPPPMPPDLTNFTDEELTALEGNERKNLEERIKLLRNIQLMLDAVNILMNNYQIVSARTQTLNPHQNATREPTRETSMSINSSTATPVTNTSTAKTADVKTDELPSTSAEAAALLKTITKAEVTPSNIVDAAFAKHNEVIIEDLGREDLIDVQPSTSSSNSSTTLTDGTSEHINELRKRRLKFLEECHQVSTD